MNDDLLPVPPLPDPTNYDALGKYRIAMIIDNKVHNVLLLEPIEAAQYLSSPIFVQIPQSLYVDTTFLYDGTNFIQAEL